MAAEELVTMLRGQTGPVTIVGHTDPAGPADYNRALSLRRAEAVKRFLNSRSVKTDIAVEGRGEDEPIDQAMLPPAMTENEEVYHRVLRRVEVSR
jgi:outer membrane protein OmpA-like peptidoglycan-associated protein